MASTARTTTLATNRWSLGAHDLLIVAVFGMWSLVLGLSPVLAFHAWVRN